MAKAAKITKNACDPTSTLLTHFRRPAEIVLALVSIILPQELPVASQIPAGTRRWKFSERAALNERRPARAACAKAVIGFSSRYQKHTSIKQSESAGVAPHQGSRELV